MDVNSLNFTIDFEAELIGLFWEANPNQSFDLCHYTIQVDHNGNSVFNTTTTENNLGLSFLPFSPLPTPLPGNYTATVTVTSMCGESSNGVSITRIVPSSGGQ